MFRKPNASSGVPIYKQLKDQVLHLVETGVLKQGDQLPSIRALAESLVVNPNTIVRIYRELEQEGLIVVSHGLGAFIAITKDRPTKKDLLKKGQSQFKSVIVQLTERGLDQKEIRRLFEASLRET
ncbi:MAG TPA: GntR family transcriptional regulator [Puia sp.]|nr:GntR family transcriptional regulator [Puia sp.]